MNRYTFWLFNIFFKSKQPINPINMNGILIQNIHLQFPIDIKRPPILGPNTGPIPNKMLKVPNAGPCLCSGMVVVIIAVAVPCNIAAPMPCKPRKVINSTTLLENPHKIEDIKNTVSPIL